MFRRVWSVLSQNLSNINFKINLLLFFLTLIVFDVNGQKSWELVKNNSGIELWTKDFPESKIKQFKLRTLISCSLHDAYVVLKDIKNMSHWYDRIKKVELLKEISQNEGMYLLEYELPIPFENRFSTVYGKIEFTPDKLTATTEYKKFHLPGGYDDKIIVTQLWSTWEIIPKSEGQVEVTHSGFMDPKGNIPDWLINDGVTSGPLKTIRAFKNQISQI